MSDFGEAESAKRIESELRAEKSRKNEQRALEPYDISMRKSAKAGEGENRTCKDDDAVEKTLLFNPIDEAAKLEKMI